MARLTLNGMYEYDQTLFDGMILPEDYERDALLFEILQRSGQLYPYHQHPVMLKTAIRLWFSRNFLNFDRTMEALMSEYDPIENYNRFEDWTRTPDLTNTDVKTGSDTLTHSGDDTLSHTGDDTLKHSDKDTTTYDYTGQDPYTEKTVRGEGPHTTEEQVSAYDSGTYQPSKKTIEDWGANAAARTDEKSLDGKYKEELAYGHQEKTTYNSDEKTTYGSTVTGRHTGTEKYTAHMHGNIGVTTTQEMITQEIELRKFDIYTDIASRFEHEFLVQVY